MSAVRQQNQSSNSQGLTLNLFDMLSTTVEWMLDTGEMDKNYNECKLEIDRLEKLPSAELAKLGITKDQIPVFVFSNLFGSDANQG